MRQVAFCIQLIGSSLERNVERVSENALQHTQEVCCQCRLHTEVTKQFGIDAPRGNGTQPPFESKKEASNPLLSHSLAVPRASSSSSLTGLRNWALSRAARRQADRGRHRGKYLYVLQRDLALHVTCFTHLSRLIQNKICITHEALFEILLRTRRNTHSPLNGNIFYPRIFIELTYFTKNFGLLVGEFA